MTPVPVEIASNGGIQCSVIVPRLERCYETNSKLMRPAPKNFGTTVIGARRLNTFW